MSPDLLFEIGIGCLVVGMLAGFGLFVLGLCDAARRGDGLFPTFDDWRDEQDDDREQEFAERYAELCDETKAAW